MSDAGCMSAGVGWKGQVLEAPNVRLRRFAAADADALIAVAGDEDVARTTGHLAHPFGPDEARAFLAAAREGEATGRELRFAVERRVAPGVVGCASVRFGADEADLTYWIGKAFQGRGFAAEAVHALIRLLFRNFKVPSVRAEVMEGNAPSERVLERVGFSQVGTAIGGACDGRCADMAVTVWRLSRADWEAREAQKPTLLVAAAALIDGDGRVLVAQRPEGKALAGLWEFPGGKVDPGETPEAALVRELHEELGIDITESCLAPLTFASHPYDRFHLLMPLYVCRTWKGTVTAREGQELKWVRPVRLGDLPLPPADIPLVPLLMDFL